MRKVLSGLLSLAVLAVVPQALRAAIPTYDNLYVFGDSYCDVGNLSIASQGVEPGPYYFNGRFSNGPLWVDHVAGFLGLPMKPALAGGTNYAFGGAWVTAPQTIPGGTIPSVPEQVLLYLSQHGNKADPNALYILEGGGNDILNTTTGSPEFLGFEIALGITDSERILRQAGAKNFLIPNLFNVGLLPAAAGNVAFAKAASYATNEAIDILLAFEPQPHVTILRIDVFSMMNSIEKDPTHLDLSTLLTPA
jgi:outer membrane lipase/esterase